MNKFVKCLAILLRTKTNPRQDRFWIFTSVFLTLLKHPGIILKKNWRGGTGFLLSDYLPHSITVTDPYGVVFTARPKFEDLARFLFGETLAKWEPRSIIDLQNSGSMIDIGANTGYYTLYLAKKNNKSKIISIEANPQTARILEENCKLNRLSNVTIHNIAVSNKSGKLALYQSSNNSGANSIFSTNSDDSSKVFVNSNTLDSILENEKFANIDWIKIDVEGAELFVLLGSTKTLQRTKKILIEVHEHILNQNNQKPQDIIEILKNSGFSIKLFSEYWNPITSPNKSLKSDYVLGERLDPKL